MMPIRPPPLNSLSQTKPKLYSQLLCLLYRLSSSHPSSGPMIQHLSPKTSPGLVAPLILAAAPAAAASSAAEDGDTAADAVVAGAGGGLRGILVGALPGGAGEGGATPSAPSVHALVASLHQRSWALRLQALMMLRLEDGEAAQVCPGFRTWGRSPALC